MKDKGKLVLSQIVKLISSVIRQKGESQNGCFKKAKHAKFRKTNISYPLGHTRTCKIEQQ